MSLQSVAKRFVELCNQEKNFDVMREMYTEGMVSAEASGQETTGKAAVIAKSERWAASNTIHSETVRGPFFHAPNQFAVHFTFEVTPRSTGQRTTLEEVAVYTVDGNDQITREVFYYAGDW